MTLHDPRQPRSALVFAACGVLSLGMTISCTGAIMDGPGADPPDITTGGRGGRGGSGGSGGTGGPDILPPPPIGACETKEYTPARVWRISDDQYVAAVKDLVPGVEVPTILTPGRSSQQFVDFAELFEIGPATASDIRASANAVAGDAVKNLDALLACKAGEAPAACSNRFIEDFASRAFRRPLEANEKTGLKAVYTAGAMVSPAEGIKMAISAVLQSASFLYRTELGKAGNVAPGQAVELTPHELASSLSFLFLNSIPDAELRASADDGSLLKADVFRGHVERLIKMPRVQDHLTIVYLKWVGLGAGLNSDLATQEKEFTPTLKASMEEETKLFFKELISKGGTVKDVLTSDKGFVDKVLGTHLGVAGPAMGFGSVNYPTDQRSGILTLSGVLARYSLGHAEVFRGKFVRDELFCQEIPPPPNIPEVEEETKAAENLPVREQVNRRLKNATCAGCHEFMDPLGLAFSNYDALGRYRTMDASGPIDAKGTISGVDDANGAVANARELGQKLSESAIVRTCISSKMLSYALGRMTGTIDSCELKKIDGFVTQGGGKLSDLMAAVVYSSAFRMRTGGK
jgi:hypothetical protein